MDWSFILQQCALLCLGAALGFFGGVFGIGGGIIAVPLFVLGFGMDQALAQGTALVLMVPNLMIAWWRYNKKHQAPIRLALGIAATGTLTTGLSAQIAVGLDQSVLHALFNSFLLIVGCRQLLQGAHSPHAQQHSPLSTRTQLAIPVVGVLGGACMGLLGLGGALVSTPILNGLLQLSQTLAQSLSLALVFPSSAMALASYTHTGHVDWQIGLPLAIGGLFSVSAGVNLAHRLPEHTMRRAFACLMIITALWLFIRG